jgi:hypothetical protein
MNIKRGLFRVWVILSVAWIVLVGFLAFGDSGPGYVEPRNVYFKRSFGDGKKPFEKYSNHPLKPLGISQVQGAHSSQYTYDKGGSVATSAEIDQALASNQAAGNLYKIRLDKHPQFTLYVPTDIDDAERDRQIDEVDRIATRIQELVTAKRRKEAIKNAVIAGFGVPLGLLLAGTAIYWAFAGFARPKPSD